MDTTLNLNLFVGHLLTDFGHVLGAEIAFWDGKRRKAEIAFWEKKQDAGRGWDINLVEHYKGRVR